MKLSINFTILLFTLSALTSCFESDLSMPARNQLAGEGDEGKSYFISHARVELDDLSGTVDLDNCITDNTIIYYPDGAYEENEGRSKCSPSDPPGLIGNWMLDEDNSEITITIGGQKTVWEIVSIDNSSLELTRKTNQGIVTYILKAL